jgi:hypothetical protein
MTATGEGAPGRTESPPRVRPTSWPEVAERVVDLVVARPPDTRTRLAIDGAAATGSAELAAAVVERLPVRGRAAFRVPANGFLRAASLRLEPGREDPDAYFDWLDAAALTREVLDPMGPRGSSRFLPVLRDPQTDRSVRAETIAAPPGAVVVVDGTLLLGRGLPFDITVHLALSMAALARRTAPDMRWTLPAFERYADEVRPEAVADLVVSSNDPRRPALVL